MVIFRFLFTNVNTFRVESMGFFTGILRCSAECILIALLLAFVPGIPPDGKFFSEEVVQPAAREGPFAPNNVLDNGVRLFENRFNAPESVASRGKDEIFVSMHGGSIVKVFGKEFSQFKEIVKIGPGCNYPWEERICGRPLGLRFARDGKLLVADGYFGIFKVDVDKGTKEQILDSQRPINGAKPLLVDDLDEDDEGNIYWSDASSAVDLTDGILEPLIGPSGRLLKLDARTGHSLVVVDNLMFANGVQMSPQKNFVLVCETFKHRVLRYWLKGPKAGKVETFVEGLPGYPDNIRPIPTGGYYVSLVSVKDPDMPDLMRAVHKLPWLKRLFARLLYGTKKLFELVSYIYPNEMCDKIAYSVCCTGSLASVMNGNRTMVVLLDENGKVTSTMQGNSGVLRFISETTQVGDKLFFGSPYNQYLGMLQLKKPEREIKSSFSEGIDEKAAAAIKKDEL